MKSLELKVSPILKTVPKNRYFQNFGMRLSSRDTSPEMAIKKVRALTDQVPNLIHLYITRQAIARFDSRA